MTLGVGTTNELDVSGLGTALDDPGSITTGVGVVEVVPEGVAGAAASLVHPARPVKTIATRATANLLVIGRTPWAAVGSPCTIAAICDDLKPGFGMWTTSVS